MSSRICALCFTQRSMLRRPKTGQQICKTCFFAVFEAEVHQTIIDNQLFKRGERIAIGASGGKGELYLTQLKRGRN
jgi:cytoplasmic tRNA 2-thiolation protein 1